jgi:hypothetical protein
LKKIGLGVMCARDSWTRELWLEKTYIYRYFHMFDVATGFEMSCNVRHRVFETRLRLLVNHLLIYLLIKGRPILN